MSTRRRRHHVSGGDSEDGAAFELRREVSTLCHLRSLRTTLRLRREVSRLLDLMSLRNFGVEVLKCQLETRGIESVNLAREKPCLLERKMVPLESGLEASIQPIRAAAGFVLVGSYMSGIWISCEGEETDRQSCSTSKVEAERKSVLWAPRIGNDLFYEFQRTALILSPTGRQSPYVRILATFGCEFNLVRSSDPESWIMIIGKSLIKSACGISSSIGSELGRRHDVAGGSHCGIKKAEIIILHTSGEKTNVRE
ncbi:hypothetical protein C8R43DRAFT_1112833 [Mycena crocata]|nr:hypothetical protein C8R43DRAFT_1112833 [Mycena crocata]